VLTWLLVCIPLCVAGVTGLSLSAAAKGSKNTIEIQGVPTSMNPSANFFFAPSAKTCAEAFVAGAECKQTLTINGAKVELVDCIIATAGTYISCAAPPGTPVAADYADQGVAFTVGS
jgi:hypothetical protein